MIDKGVVSNGRLSGIAVPDGKQVFLFRIAPSQVIIVEEITYEEGFEPLEGEERECVIRSLTNKQLANTQAKRYHSLFEEAKTFINGSL